MKQTGLAEEYVSESSYYNYQWYRPEGNIKLVLEKYNARRQRQP